MSGVVLGRFSSSFREVLGGSKLFWEVLGGSRQVLCGYGDI